MIQPLAAELEPVTKSIFNTGNHGSDKPWNLKLLDRTKQMNSKFLYIDGKGDADLYKQVHKIISDLNSFLGKSKSKVGVRVSKVLRNPNKGPFNLGEQYSHHVQFAKTI